MVKAPNKPKSDPPRAVVEAENEAKTDEDKITVVKPKLTPDTSRAAPVADPALIELLRQVLEGQRKIAERLEKLESERSKSSSDVVKTLTKRSGGALTDPRGDTKKSFRKSIAGTSISFKTTASTVSVKYKGVDKNKGKTGESDEGDRSKKIIDSF